MLSFPPGAAWFAVAGAVAALGPIVLHLLNRQRYVRLDWAAMDFLREAVERTRRRLRLRDLLLLMVRTLALVLLGLALARPQWNVSGTAAGNEPVHAVVVVDNSLSMAYRRLDGTLLDEARAQARAWIEALPPGSRVSIAPLCRQPAEYSLVAHRSRTELLEALSGLEIVDRLGSAQAGIELVREAWRRTNHPAVKRALLIGDQQALNWSTAARQALAECPELEVVQVAAESVDNAAVEEVRIASGVADAEAPATIAAVIRYAGPRARSQCSVTLTVDGVPVDSQAVDLEPGQAREVIFSHQFVNAAETGIAAWSTVTISLSPDRLPEDDARSIVVPVLSGVPVVFVDQLGDDEDLAQGKIGETYRLRRLLAPPTTRGSGRALIRTRHVRVEQVDRELLRDARLVVVAGVAAPDEMVELLREYVEQGGPLLVAAGGDFSPTPWNEAAWRSGHGILPAPLKPEFVGRRPSIDDNDPLLTFRLATSSLQHPWFRLEGVGNQELDDLYREPLFFQAVDVDLASAATAQSSTAAPAAGPSAVSTTANWLVWASEFGPESGRDGALAQIVAPAAAVVVATYSNGQPFLVERRVGRGRLLFCTTAVQSDWNTLTTTHAVVVFDRLARSLIDDTLPRRNFGIDEPIRLPIDPRERHLRFTLTLPSGPDEPLVVDPRGDQGYVVTLPTLAERGIYRIRGERAALETADSAAVVDVVVAVQGPERESDLLLLAPEEVAALGEGTDHANGLSPRVLGSRTSVRGHRLGRWFLAAVLVGLIVEMGILAGPRLRERAD